VLASADEPEHGDSGWYHHYIVTIGIVGAIVLVVVVLIRVRIQERANRNPEIRGPAVAGTALVLSVEHAGGGGESDFHFLRIGPRVQFSGRQPYDLTVSRKVHVIHLASVQPGSIVPVQVDANDPQIVRIDFDQRIT
jgi:hypothetical protein